MENTLKVGDWVKLERADSADRGAELHNGAIGKVLYVDSFDGPTVDFGGDFRSRYMASSQCVAITPAEAASVGDTVTVSPPSMGVTAGDHVVMEVDDLDVHVRLKVADNGAQLWVSNTAVSSLTRKADAKPAPVAKHAKVGDFVKVTAKGAENWERLRAGMVGRVVKTHEGVEVLFPYWTEGHGSALAGSHSTVWNLFGDEYEISEEPYQYKVGDWVTQSAHSFVPKTPGRVAVVEGGYVSVEYPGWTDGHGGIDSATDGIKSRWNLRHEYLSPASAPAAALTLVPATPKPAGTFIVIGDKGAAAHPFKHPTFESATREAERLSKMNPGVNFTVFKSAAVAHTAKPVLPATVLEMVA